MSNILGNMPPVFGSGYRGVVPAPTAADVSAQNILRADGTWGAQATTGPLPSQTGNAGELLTTDGTNASWTPSLNDFSISNLTFGTSGPSAKSSIAARAARQAIVSDGTAGSGATYTIPAFGTSDFTVSVFAKYPSGIGNTTIVGGAGTNSFELTTDSSSTMRPYAFAKNVGAVLQATTAVESNKWTLITYTRASGVGTFYINGVASGSGADTTNYSNPSTKFISDGQTHLSPFIFNRALTAAEVVSLYESGVPSGSDYNSASNTLLNTSTALNAYSTSFTTFTGASATGFTASDATASKSPRVIFPLSGTLVAGRRYRAKFTATLTAMSSVNLWQSDSSYAGLANLGAVSSGSNEFTFTATSSVNAMMLLCTTDGSVGTHSVVISGLSVDTPGLLLAPDAAQAGGGLTWYDTSGNAANITLPASGVTWNVPSSLKTASGWTFGGAVLVNTSTDNSATFAVNRSGVAPASSGSTSTAAIRAVDVSNDLALDIGVNAAASPYPGWVQVHGRTNQATNYPLALNPNGGNVLVGTTTDNGAKFQVEGYATFNRNGADGYLSVSRTSGVTGTFGAGSTNSYLGTATNHPLVLYTNNTTALTLDSSQNATFAGATSIFGGNKSGSQIRITGDASATAFGYTWYSGTDYESSLRHVATTGVLTLDVGRSSSWGGKFDIFCDTTRAARFTKTVAIIDGKINAAGLPTSSAGLSAGDLWVDTAAGNVVKRV